MYALWGQDLTPLYGQTFNFSGDGEATYPVTLPAAGTITSAHDANTVILFCLSCHDGVLTNVGMMKGQTVETLPIVGGTAPTLLARRLQAAGRPIATTTRWVDTPSSVAGRQPITGTAPAAATPPLSQ